jgi:uncharacterized membrane protein
MQASLVAIDSTNIGELVVGGSAIATLAGVVAYLVTKFIPNLLSEHKATIGDMTARHESAVKVLVDAQAKERSEHREERRGAVEAIQENTLATRELADAVKKIVGLGGDK